MCDELDVIQREWHKLERNFNKTGLREGISDGRDTNFQTSFDKGFADGFKNGLAIGECKGRLVFDKTGPTNHPLLSSPKSGWCQLCETENFNQTINEAHQAQSATFNTNLSTLNQIFDHK